MPTGKEICELIVKALKKFDYKHFSEVTPDQIWNISPSGELFQVFELYWWAKSYLGV